MQHTSNNIPVINISALLNKDVTQWHEVIQNIDFACRNSGFFYITGHGVDTKLVSQVLEQARLFFNQDNHSKCKNIRSNNKYHMGYSPVGSENLDLDIMGGDYKESFDISPDLSRHDLSLYPDIPDFISVMLNYYDALYNISMRLLETMASAIGEPQDLFTNHFKQCSGIILRLNHYPPCSNKIRDSIIAGAHTDYGYLTLLYQDDIGGLQIQDKQGHWIDIPNIPDSFVVNIGDLMQMLTNDTYKSTLHRVLLKDSNKSRFSIPYFVEPNYNTVIKCLPSCVSIERPALYPTVVSGEWITSKLRKTYKI